MKVLLLIFVGVGFLIAIGTWLSNIFSKKNKESDQEDQAEAFRYFSQIRDVLLDAGDSDV